MSETRESLGIYIHVPFCKSRCIYCDFVSSVGDCKEREKYVGYLLRQIDLAAKEYGDSYVADTMYIGGGTPALLDGEQLKSIAKSIYADFKTNLKEFTVEANPCTIEKEKLIALKEMGASRLSIGVQSFNDGLLCALGRRHNAKEAQEAISLAKSAGFDVSVDAMIGLPNQSREDIEDFIDRASRLGADHISVYMLSVEKGTPLKKLIDKGELIAPDDDEVAVQYDYARERLKINGYDRYEISNFCRDGRVCHHNLKYWRCKDYLGLGVGAHSLTRGERWRNYDSFGEYFNGIDGKSFKRSIEILSEKDKIEEYIMLALRLKEGVDFADFKDRFNSDFLVRYKDAINKNRRFLDIKEERLSIKDEYLQVMNGIIIDFLD